MNFTQTGTATRHGRADCGSQAPFQRPTDVRRFGRQYRDLRATPHCSSTGVFKLEDDS
jgi:ABC-type uncharacterized transport system auxiliary subunit